MAQPSNLYTLAQDLMTVVVKAFADDGQPLPEHQYITTGPALPDCESCVVSLERVRTGLAGFAETPSPVTGATTRVAELAVTIFRCVVGPEGEGFALNFPPTIDALNAEAELIMTDGYVLHRGIHRAVLAGTFRGTCEHVSLGAAEMLAHQADIGGTQMIITAELS